MYMETQVTLDSLDIRNLIMLVDARMEELKAFKEKHGEESIPAMLADEQLSNYRATRKRLNYGLRDIKARARNGRNRPVSPRKAVK